MGQSGGEESFVWTPEATLKLKPITAVRVSPDGRRAVFTVGDVVMTDDQSERRNQIWLANVDGSDAYQATHADCASENPQWSPDGNFIAFVSKRGEYRQLFVLRTTGGEAEAITDGTTEVADFRWSPDSQSIAILAPSQPPDGEKRKKAKDDWSWKDEDPKNNQVHLVSLTKNTDGQRPLRLLVGIERHVVSVNWSPDGKQIVFDHQASPVADDWVTSKISLVDIETGEIRGVSAGSGAQTRPLFSPQGDQIACIVTDDPARWYFRADIWIVPLDGNPPRALAATPEESPTLVGWSANGDLLYFSEPWRTTTRLYAVSLSDDACSELLSSGVYAEFNLNATGAWLGYTYQDMTTPVEAYATPLPELQPHKISTVHAEVSTERLPRAELLRWKATDGMEIEGILSLPADYKHDRRIPLLLVIHGGPTGVFVEQFLGNSYVYPTAVFAEKGWAVLRCNPRGSSGYGAAFRAANLRDWGGADYDDLMCGVDAVIASGIADPDRLGVMGWSYGGFMTSWILTQTNRFKAASIGAPVTNLMSFNGTADIPSFIPDYFDAEFWDEPEVYHKHSPMFHVKNVSTPALIQHGEADIRVPIAQGYEYFSALKRRGVETRMIVFPRQPHGLIEPRMVLKAMETNVEWFEERLK